MSVGFRISCKSLLLTSLLVVVLVCSLLVCVSVNDSIGDSLTTAVHVKNEEELKNAINAATSKGTTIALDKDITLTDTLTIPSSKNITLTSNKNSGFYKLIGTAIKSIIIVESNGVLRLDGVVVTNGGGMNGGGVYVKATGQLFLYSGEISGNTVIGIDMPGTVGGRDSYGGGVYNLGVFEMSGGKITDNKASVGYGGGVCNWGTFKMYGGEISNNHNTQGFSTDGDIRIGGGGVHNVYGATFEMSGGKITDNKAEKEGGGVYNFGTFTMFNGEITRNTASVYGGGVCSLGQFSLSDGKITSNTAHQGGGVYIYKGTFDRSGGTVSGNKATTGQHNDVYQDSGSDSNNSNGTSDGNNGSVGDNNETNNDSNKTPSNNGDGTNNGNNEQFTGGFSVRDFVIICVGATVITIGIIIIVLLFSFQKRIEQVEEKIKPSDRHNT